MKEEIKNKILQMNEELEKFTQISQRLQELEDEGLGEYIDWNSFKNDYNDFIDSSESVMIDLFGEDKRKKIEDLFHQYDEETLGGVENGVWTEKVFENFKKELEQILNEHGENN